MLFLKSGWRCDTWRKCSIPGLGIAMGSLGHIRADRRGRWLPLGGDEMSWADLETQIKNKITDPRIRFLGRLDCGDVTPSSDFLWLFDSVKLSASIWVVQLELGNRVGQTDQWPFSCIVYKYVLWYWFNDFRRDLIATRFIWNSVLKYILPPILLRSKKRRTFFLALFWYSFFVQNKKL